MSETEYLKCPCKECGNNIEYPLAAARDTVPCPHCGEWTELPAPEEESEVEPVVRSLLGVVILVLLPAVALSVGAYFWLRHSRMEAIRLKPPAIVAASIPVKKNPGAPAVAAAPVKPPSESESTNPPPPGVKKPKSADDLVLSRISLEKTKGTGLVHAVGTVRNNSDYERFRVKIVLDLMNKQGMKIGSTEDQKSIIEPHEKWKFHALVADRQATSARMASLTEEP